jgi:hypothetical protein
MKKKINIENIGESENVKKMAYQAENRRGGGVINNGNGGSGVKITSPYRASMRGVTIEMRGV